MPETDPLDDRPAGAVQATLEGVAARLGLPDPLAGAPEAEVRPAAAHAVGGVTLASDQVRPGDLYAALPGARTHGARFAADAVARGASAVLTDPAGEADAVAAGRPVLVVPDPRAVLGGLAAEVYGHPGERLRTLGVTGTQGKTTTTQLAQSALRAAGAKPAVVGTSGTRIDGRPVRSALTTPEAPALHALLAVMVEQGVDTLAMEVSSHALVQHRVDGLVYDVAVFLNLGRDHLDFHADMEDYFAAKATLFTPEHARAAVVDVDDPWGARLAASTTLPVTTVALDGPADWTATDLVPGTASTRARLRGPGVDLPLGVPLPGRFNVRNAVAAVAGLALLGHDPESLVAGVARSSGVPGRMERIEAGQPFTALVDYAHKPDALRAVLEAVRPTTDGRVLVVLGAGGDRDAGKRPLMGRVAAELADVVVVTDDNPRREDPAAIRAALLAGARDAADRDVEVVEIADRAEAVATAVSLARAGDCLVVAGKGDETGQVVGEVVHPFDDRDVLREALAGVVT